ncbi:MAG TPA: SLBB domain-containing protein, partial [Roseiflexaceae bacterium]|nr:SLBB domain-containing protein [Roseiflexaceae bacterium]
AGAFVCGEETALIASIEGHRGTPPPRPPYPAQSGLWGCPTLINNVETFANIVPIIRRGADWYASIGTEKSRGTKVFALAGQIRNTGLIEVPMGTTLRQIVEDLGGGTPDGTPAKAVQTGGPSRGGISGQLFRTPAGDGAPGPNGSAGIRAAAIWRLPRDGSCDCGRRQANWSGITANWRPRLRISVGCPAEPNLSPVVMAASRSSLPIRKR